MEKCCRTEYPEDPFISFEMPKAIDYFSNPEIKKHIRKLMVSGISDEKLLMEEGVSYGIILSKTDLEIRTEMLEGIEKDNLLASGILDREDEIKNDLKLEKEKKQINEEKQKLQIYIKLFNNKEIISYIEGLIEMGANDTKFLINEGKAYEKILGVNDDKKRQEMKSAISEGLFASYVAEKYGIK